MTTTRDPRLISAALYHYDIVEFLKKTHTSIDGVALERDDYIVFANYRYPSVFPVERLGTSDRSLSTSVLLGLQKTRAPGSLLRYGQMWADTCAHGVSMLMVMLPTDPEMVALFGPPHREFSTVEIYHYEHSTVLFARVLFTPDGQLRSRGHPIASIGDNRPIQFNDDAKELVKMFVSDYKTCMRPTMTALVCAAPQALRPLEASFLGGRDALVNSAAVPILGKCIIRQDLPGVPRESLILKTLVQPRTNITVFHFYLGEADEMRERLTLPEPSFVLFSKPGIILSVSVDECDVKVLSVRSSGLAWLWRTQHEIALDTTLALAPLMLPIYVVVEILDWLSPEMAWQNPSHKVTLVQRVADAVRRRANK